MWSTYAKKNFRLARISLWHVFHFGNTCSEISYRLFAFFKLYDFLLALRLYSQIRKSKSNTNATVEPTTIRATSQFSKPSSPAKGPPTGEEQSTPVDSGQRHVKSLSKESIGLQLPPLKQGGVQPTGKK